jgi:anaerobic magnesium-protoporphyrin IX monomethyl ester cyclase
VARRPRLLQPQHGGVARLPFRCNWCAKPIWGNRYLQRPAADVAAEMTYLKHTFNPDHIWFADDIFGFRVDWVTEFAAAVHRAHGSIPFTIQTRADLMSDAMARALKDAHCREVWLGAESGSQKILDAMNKGTQVEDIPIARERLGAQTFASGSSSSWAISARSCKIFSPPAALSSAPAPTT